MSGAPQEPRRSLDSLQSTQSARLTSQDRPMSPFTSVLDRLAHLPERYPADFIDSKPIELMRSNYIDKLVAMNPERLSPITANPTRAAFPAVSQSPPSSSPPTIGPLPRTTPAGTLGATETRESSLPKGLLKYWDGSRNVHAISISDVMTVGELRSLASQHSGTSSVLLRLVAGGRVLHDKDTIDFAVKKGKGIIYAINMMPSITGQGSRPTDDFLARLDAVLEPLFPLQRQRDELLEKFLDSYRRWSLENKA